MTREHGPVSRRMEPPVSDFIGTTFNQICFVVEDLDEAIGF
jgi:hypothetical protein